MSANPGPADSPGLLVVLSSSPPTPDDVQIWPLAHRNSPDSEYHSFLSLIMRRRSYLVIFVAVVLRLVLFAAFPSLPDLLTNRVEISTPVTSFKRLQEGLFLYTHGVSPYDGGVFHQVRFSLCPLFPPLASLTPHPGPPPPRLLHHPPLLPHRHQSCLHSPRRLLRPRPHHHRLHRHLRRSLEPQGS